MEARMNRREFMKAVGSVTAALAVPGCAGTSASRRLPGGPEKRPNILFILVDDMGWPDLGCYGSKFHETPNINSLARDGMRFTDAYAACPVCSPTRASILAGQYPARVGITDFIPGHYRPWAKLTVPENRLQLPPASVTVAEVLSSHGYATGHIGKWHLGGKAFGPDKQGFDKVVLGVPNRNDKQVGGFTEQAIAFIEENKDGPFFLHLSHHTVHIPLEAPQDLIEKYKNKPKPAEGVNHPVYAAMIEHLDNSVGRILKKLDELGISERTLVIFFSDNGGLRRRYDGKGQIVSSNAPLRDEKGTLYEGGIRVPLIVRWPGVVGAGTICSEPVSSVDFYPTFLEVSGARGDRRHKLDGASIAGLLKQSGRFKRDAIFWHYPHYHHSTPGGAIRQGDWKLIEYYEDGRVELYNLKDDIGEARNLAKEEPKKASQLKRKLAAWRKSVGAKMPTPNPDYDPAKAGQWGRRQ